MSYHLYSWRTSFLFSVLLFIILSTQTALAQDDVPQNLQDFLSQVAVVYYAGEDNQYILNLSCAEEFASAYEAGEGLERYQIELVPQADADSLYVDMSVMAISPDGEQIAYILKTTKNTAELFLIDADGSNRQKLQTFDSGHHALMWSPDSTQFAYSVRPSDEAQAPQIYLRDRDGLNSLTLVQGMYPSWSPDGSQIAFYRKGVEFNIQTLAADVFIINRDGTNEQFLGSRQLNASTPITWSPDGSEPVYTVTSEGLKLKVIDPQYSPDGNYVPFILHENGNPKFQVLNISTDTVHDLIPDLEGNVDISLFWSADNRYLLYRADEGVAVVDHTGSYQQDVFFAGGIQDVGIYEGPDVVMQLVPAPAARKLCQTGYAFLPTAADFKQLTQLVREGEFAELRQWLGATPQMLVPLVLVFAALVVGGSRILPKLRGSGKSRRQANSPRPHTQKRVLRKDAPNTRNLAVATPSKVFDLDSLLLQLSPSDNWTIRDAVEGVQIFGGIGSGKTSGSGAAIARAFLHAGFGGLVLCAKPGEKQLWISYAKETGREDDLIIFSADSKWRFNFLEYEFKRKGVGGGQGHNIVDLFLTIHELIEGKVTANGGDKFWDRATEQMIRNAVTILVLSKTPLSVKAINELIITAPLSPQQIEDSHWRQNSFCAQCIQAASTQPKSQIEQHNFDVATTYWLKEFPNQGDRTRSSIIATFTSMASKLLDGLVWNMFSTDLNIVPEVTYRNGAIIILDFSVQEWNEIGRVVQGIFKYAFQQSILRRDTNKHPRPVFLFADESQHFISSHDFMFQSTVRDYLCCTVYASQNISNYYAKLKSPSGRDEVNSLLGNLRTKIFHANDDPPTNEYASNVIGKIVQNRKGTGITTNENQGQESHSTNVGTSEVVDYKVLPVTYSTLKTGGEPNNLEVEAIVYRGGKILNFTNETYIKAIFQQRSRALEGVSEYDV